MLASSFSFPTSIVNDPSRKGELAARKQLFGDAKRYAIAPVHTRFDRVSWFVWDAERLGPDGRPEVIRQEDTFEAAMRDLGIEDVDLDEESEANADRQFADPAW